MIISAAAKKYTETEKYNKTTAKNKNKNPGKIFAKFLAKSLDNRRN